MFENPRRGRQARNFGKNVPKILDLKSSSEQIFSENCRWVPLLPTDPRRWRDLQTRNYMELCPCSGDLIFSWWRTRVNGGTWILTNWINLFNSPIPISSHFIDEFKLIIRYVLSFSNLISQLIVQNTTFLSSKLRFYSPIFRLTC